MPSLYQGYLNVAVVKVVLLQKIKEDGPFLLFSGTFVRKKIFWREIVKITSNPIKWCACPGFFLYLTNWVFKVNLAQCGNSRIFCNSDFTWNQFWQVESPKNGHIGHFGRFQFWKFLTNSKLCNKIVEMAVFDLLKSANIDFT